MFVATKRMTRPGNGAPLNCDRHFLAFPCLEVQGCDILIDCAELMEVHA
ncbi:hypothetical protein [Oscillatoria acuminata]|uniref:Uncharacterized protein n=1 Tax=Oscillatoria acuminata PCC 6304 TaxID=56110 RepID=K9TDR2_9CYAN|nr:hypothetical protein [Oscillatoria acuminata]AFY80558.1 hypothetical protein Oscil6304_0823 [Oscillatoria acuminata PCC 6304]